MTLRRLRRLLRVLLLLVAPPATAAASASQCLSGDPTCLPAWEPTWDMFRSTVLYTCNNSGFHDVHHAVQFGTVVYDWSNAKAVWANAHPMDSEACILKQAEAVLAVDPGVPKQGPRVWAYRNTIKALNWYSSVREKLDDPKYSSWFIKFKDYHGRASNGSYAVPACDWYGNATSPAKCSGFYHDQEQTPEHRGGGPDYPVDGQCVEQCDCGETNPCGEYIFDHRGGEVDGQNFTEWFISSYMISEETLLHRDPKTGRPQMIGLGWLDDAMTLQGPTEEDRNFQQDAGLSNETMQELVDAYRNSMEALKAKVLPMGGYWWQLMDGAGMQLNRNFPVPVNASRCVDVLRTRCGHAAPPTWKRMQMYNIPKGGAGVDDHGFTQYTAEFLLTRGPFAMLGYSWYGCTNGDAAPNRAKEWDMDFGVPSGTCQETGENTGVFSRTYSKATVEWDCHAAEGKITQHITTGP